MHCTHFKCRAMCTCGCHTDIHFLKNDLGFSVYPLVPGHEIVGTVTGTGASVTKFRKGDDLLGLVQTVLDLLPNVAEQLLVPKLVTQLLPTAFQTGEITKGTIGETFGNTKIRGKAASAAIGIDCSMASRVLEEIIELNKSIPFAGALALRFVKGTSAFLGFTRFPVTCVLEMDGVDSSSSRNFFNKIWLRLEQLNIPYTLHWGKINFNLTEERVRRMYGNANVNTWIASRKKLLDEATRKVFTNDFMIRCGLNK